MLARAVWPQDPIFIELGVQDAQLGSCLRHAGFSKYLGVSTDQRHIARLHEEHPDFRDQLTFSDGKKLVLHNNAEVLALSGQMSLFVWRYRWVRHAQQVMWRCSFHPYSLIAWIGCVFHFLHRRYSWPRLVTLRSPEGTVRRMFVSRVLKYKLCHRRSLHFVPHQGGLSGLFRKFDQHQVRYVVLRWFEKLPEIEPSEDVDMLIEDASLAKALEIMRSMPGVQQADVFSESGLARSDYNGVPYYPPDVARRILDGAVRHKNLCPVPSPRDYFHSLAYHAVYHKGTGSGLSTKIPGLTPTFDEGHDYAGILQQMADELGIDLEISLEGLHAYFQQAGWAPAPDLLARMVTACPKNQWLQHLSKCLNPEIVDQGLAVFVLRQEAVRRGFKNKMIEMIEQSGFELLAVKVLTPAEVQYAAARTRGGDWTSGDYTIPAGPPAVIVVAYDPEPLAPNRKQRRRFPQRTNARIFVKETIRDAIIAELPPDQPCNALHSSDHAGEAWHLIEAFAPEMIETIRSKLNSIRQPADVLPMDAGHRRGHSEEAAPAIRRAA